MADDSPQEIAAKFLDKDLVTQTLRRPQVAVVPRKTERVMRFLGDHGAVAASSLAAGMAVPRARRF